MRQRSLFVTLLLVILIIGMFPVAAQNPEPTEAPVYDPTCPINLMEAYMSGWEYDHRGSEGVIDVVTAAQVASKVHSAFEAAQIDCKTIFGVLKISLLSSMRGDYPPEDLVRMLIYIEEVIGNVPYADCSYSVATQFLQQVDWGDLPAVQVGKTMGEIFRTVRDVIPNDYCDSTFQIIKEIISYIEDIPPDSTLIATLYKVIGDATEGQYITENSCAYPLAKTFFEKVQWDNLTSDDIVKLVSDTFEITHKISGDSSCDDKPALAITAMLLNDMYRFPPDASIIQRTYDAATGELVPTPEATAPPIVN